MVRHEVEQHPDVALAGLGDELVEVGERPEDGLDVLVVGDVVAPVGIGRHRGGVQPQPVDAEPGQVVEVLDDPPQVADAVAVGVGV